MGGLSAQVLPGRESPQPVLLVPWLEGSPGCCPTTCGLCVPSTVLADSGGGTLGDNGLGRGEATRGRRGPGGARALLHLLLVAQPCIYFSPISFLSRQAGLQGSPCMGRARWGGGRLQVTWGAQPSPSLAWLSCVPGEPWTSPHGGRGFPRPGIHCPVSHPGIKCGSGMVPAVCLRMEWGGGWAGNTWPCSPGFRRSFVCSQGPDRAFAP